MGEAGRVEEGDRVEVEIVDNRERVLKKIENSIYFLILTLYGTGFC